MSLIARIVSRNNIALATKRRPEFCGASSLIASKSTGSAQQQMDDFWSKNRVANRPMSPHLTIYRPQLTSMLSITHRGTGIFLAGVTCSFAAATLLPPGAAELFLQTVAEVHNMGMGYLCLFPTKLILAWPIMFHVCNGLRHLMWDRASGLKIDDVYRSGWGVLVLSTILAALLSFALTSK